MGIQKLSAEVINKIAAGEVIERPAHLLKELIENALDAQATKVHIDVFEGSRTVLVKDNGVGMDREDLGLCLDRHATSKIQSAEDLWELHSFGFRGEALAAMAAVSRLTMTSRRKGEDQAHRIVSDFGKISEVMLSGGDFGTSVEIADLFANVPARLKFLRSDNAEYGQMKLLVKALALASPHVEFKLRIKNENVFFFLASDAKTRAESVLGEVLYSHTEPGVEVFLTPPHKSMGVAKNLFFFVNGRWVQDRSLQAAVIEAHRSFLMQGQYPQVVLHLTVPPDEVDVNIHPTKSQVKFLQPSQIFKIVSGVTRRLLENSPWRSQDLGAQSQKLGIPEWISNSELGSNPQYEILRNNPAQFAMSSPPALWVKQNSIPKVSESNEGKGNELGVSPDFLTQAAAPPILRESQSNGWAQMLLLGQTMKTYILLQSGQSLILVDQHAAHERVLFEKLWKSLQSGAVETQQFLLPLEIQMELEAVESILSGKDRLQKIGIEIEQGGPELLLVTCAPPFLREEALVKGLLQWAKNWNELGGGDPFERKLTDILATWACHSAVRAGQVLEQEEMKALLEQMDEFPGSVYCPHGRPVYVRYSQSEIERQFGRIQ